MRIKKVFLPGLVFFSLGIILPGYCRAQDLQQDLQTFFELFSKSEKLECRLSSNVYKKATDISPLMHYESTFFIDGIQFYYSVGNMITLGNKNVLLMVDKNLKRIVVTKSDPDYIRKMRSEMDQNHKPVQLADTDSIMYEGSKENQRTYVLSKPQSMIYKSVYKFDNTSGYLKSIDYIYNTKIAMGTAYASTEFTKISFNPEFPKDIFSEANYIIKTAQGYQLTPAYKSYKILVVDSDYEKYFKQ
jgi:hypothetical protein